MKRQKAVEVGEVYRISGHDGHHWMTGKVLELIENDEIARVELTEPATAFTRFPNNDAGDVLRVLLSMVRLDKAA